MGVDMTAPRHATAVRCLRLERECAIQGARCSHDESERQRLMARVADLDDAIAVLNSHATVEVNHADSPAKGRAETRDP